MQLPLHLLHAREVFGPGHRFLPSTELLSSDQIARLAASFVRADVRKIRLTGGEPLLRPDLCRIIELLRALGDDLDLALTTNGSLLPRLAPSLAQAGLDRVTVSLDSVVRRGINDGPDLADLLQLARLASDGQLYECLFASAGTDLRALVRSGVDDDALDSALRAWWGSRADRFSETRRDGATDTSRIEMSYVGG